MVQPPHHVWLQACKLKLKQLKALAAGEPLSSDVAEATAAELRGGEAVSRLVPHTEGVEAAQQDDWRTQEAWVPGVSTSRIQKKVMD